MKRRDLPVALALVAAAVVISAAALLGVPAPQPSHPTSAIPSSLPLPAGTSFPLLPQTLSNGTTLYARFFATNLTGGCQFIQGSWDATVVTTTAEGTGVTGSFHLFVFPLDALDNGSVLFESWAPDTVRVTQTIQATQPDSCNAPVVLGSWSVYNSGNMCPSVPPPPPWELRYDFALHNAGTTNVTTDIDFFFTYHTASGTQQLLEDRGTYVVPGNSTLSFTNTITYLDCPGGVGGNANLAITDERPATP